MAGGISRHVIFLPSSAREWSAERRDVVLAHELAHLPDATRSVTGGAPAVAVYWFHPLAWIAAREASVAREQACDEAVLALGTRRSVYARVLLELAESMQPPPRTLAALPMVQRSLLEDRLMAILNDDIAPVTRRRLSCLPSASHLSRSRTRSNRQFAPRHGRTLHPVRGGRDSSVRKAGGADRNLTRHSTFRQPGLRRSRRQRLAAAPHARGTRRVIPRSAAASRRHSPAAARSSTTRSAHAAATA
jgi:hypothetical protein